MKIDLLVTPGAHLKELVEAAGEAGIDTLWWVDSPALFGDPFVSMAVAATVDRRMNYGVAVVNPLSRDLLMTAASIASVNVLTQRQVLLGVGVGHTGTAAFALGRATLAQLERFVTGLRSVLAGGEFTRDDGTVERIINPVLPWFDMAKRIPVFVAAGGPRGLRMAGRVADGVLVGGLADPALIGHARQLIAAGAEQAGRDPADIEVCVTPSLAVSKDPLPMEALTESLGPKSLGPALTFRRLCTEVYGPDAPIARQLTGIEEAYRTFGVTEVDASVRHVRLLEGYMTALEDWQRPLVTEDLLELTGIYGTVGQCAEIIGRLAEAGVNHIILSPRPQHAPEALSLLKDTITGWNTAS